LIDVAVVDTGGANLASVGHALARLGRSAALVTDPRHLARARHVILPGVGAAGEAMRRLRSRGMSEALRDCEQPVLGICLGMQLLCEASDEGDATCLGLTTGHSRRLEPQAGRPVPHTGWNRVRSSGSSRLLEGLASGTYFYFVHSFALPQMPTTRGLTEHGSPFTSVLESGNLFGTQFHPERSSTQGARVLANFLGLERT
jgi:glutamine amidotransferase